MQCREHTLQTTRFSQSATLCKQLRKIKPQHVKIRALSRKFSFHGNLFVFPHQSASHERHSLDKALIRLKNNVNVQVAARNLYLHFTWNLYIHFPWNLCIRFTWNLYIYFTRNLYIHFTRTLCIHFTCNLHIHFTWNLYTHRYLIRRCWYVLKIALGSISWYFY